MDFYEPFKQVVSTTSLTAYLSAMQAVTEAEPSVNVSDVRHTFPPRSCEHDVVIFRQRFTLATTTPAVDTVAGGLVDSTYRAFEVEKDTVGVVARMEGSGGRSVDRRLVAAFHYRPMWLCQH